MPATEVSRNWFVRVTGPQEFLIQKLQLLSVEMEKGLAVYHTGEKGENPHTHFVCTTSKELQKQSWDKKLKAVFSVSGNGMYSSKVWDGNLTDEGAGTYLFHEDPDTTPVILCKNISTNEIENLKDIARKVNKVIACNKEKAETKIPQKIMVRWQEAGKPRWTDEDIVRAVCQMTTAGECYLPKTDWQWKAYIEETRLKMCETPAQFEYFVARTYNRLFPIR